MEETDWHAYVLSSVCTMPLNSWSGQNVKISDENLLRVYFSSCLKELVAAAQMLLILRTEADTIGDAAALKDPDINGPEPQHGQHDQQGLVVDVEQL